MPRLDVVDEVGAEVSNRQRIAVLGRREGFGVPGPNDAREASKNVVAVPSRVPVEIGGFEHRPKPLVVLGLEHQGFLPLPQVNDLALGEGMESRIVGQLARMTLGQIGIPGLRLGQRIQNEHRVAIGVIARARRADGWRIGRRTESRGMAPIEFERQVAPGHLPEVGARKRRVIIVRFRPRDHIRAGLVRNHRPRNRPQDPCIGVDGVVGAREALIIERRAIPVLHDAKVPIGRHIAKPVVLHLRFQPPRVPLAKLEDIPDLVGRVDVGDASLIASGIQSNRRDDPAGGFIRELLSVLGLDGQPQQLAFHDLLIFARIKIRACDEIGSGCVSEILLLHTGKSPELLLLGIIEPVMVAELTSVAVAKRVRHFHLSNHRHRKRHHMGPRLTLGFVGQTKLGAGLITDSRNSANAVGHRIQQSVPHAATNEFTDIHRDESWTASRLGIHKIRSAISIDVSPSDRHLPGFGHRQPGHLSPLIESAVAQIHPVPHLPRYGPLDDKVGQTVRGDIQHFRPSKGPLIIREALERQKFALGEATIAIPQGDRDTTGLDPD